MRRRRRRSASSSGWSRPGARTHLEREEEREEEREGGRETGCLGGTWWSNTVIPTRGDSYPRGYVSRFQEYVY